MNSCNLNLRWVHNSFFKCAIDRHLGNTCLQENFMQNTEEGGIVDYGDEMTVSMKLF